MIDHAPLAHPGIRQYEATVCGGGDQPNAQYACAREMQRDHLLDEILLIADADPNPKRARVRIDDRPLKLASRLHGPCGATHGRGLFPLAVLLRRQLTEQPFSFIVNVSKDKAIEAAAAAYIPNGQVTIPFSPMIINTGSKLIAIDTGNGLGAFASSKGVVGQARVFHSASA